MVRVRSRIESVMALDIKFRGTPYTTETYTASNALSKDDVGFPTDHQLELTHDTYDGGNIEWDQGGFFTFKGHTGSGSYPYSDFMASEVTPWKSQFTAQRICASTGPEKPAVYNFTNLLEFRDVPHMLKHAGDLLLNLRRANWSKIIGPNALAEHILAFNFGWQPLLQDLFKIMDFGNQVDKRLKELGELNSGKTIHRRVKFGGINGSATDNPFVHSTYALVLQPQRTTTWTAECWGTVRWKLRDIGSLRRVPTWLGAFNQLYGLPIGEVPVQIWKALPWSWFFDWFANVSEALEVSKNIISYEPSNICRMTHVKSTGVYKPIVASPTAHWDGMTATREVKLRDVLSVWDATGIHFRVPFMDAFKLSVFSALTIVKIRRRL